jgi:hypothetical protein
MLDKTKKYIIVQNLEDHKGYHGEEVKIISDYKCNYYLVANGMDKQWFCGEEELKEV